MALSDKEAQAIVAQLKTGLSNAPAPARNLARSARPKRGKLQPPPRDSEHEAGFRLAIDGIRADTDLRASPFGERIVLLDKPLLIWQLPNPNSDQLIATNVEPYNSWAKVYFEAVRTSFYGTLVFYWFWQNDTAKDVIVDIQASMSFDGYISVVGDGGFFGGYISSADVRVIMNVRQWLGWGLTSTGIPRDGQLASFLFPQIVVVGNIDAQGSWGPFNHPNDDTEIFSFKPAEPYLNNLKVPAGASIMVESNVLLQGDGDSLAYANFKTGGIFAPFVRFTIRTPI